MAFTLLRRLGFLGRRRRKLVDVGLGEKIGKIVVLDSSFTSSIPPRNSSRSSSDRFSSGHS